MKKEKVCSIKFDEFDLKHIDVLMKKFKAKNRSEVIRKCIDLAMYQESSLDMMNDINSKLNRLLYRETFTKKLLAQFFVNMGFAKNISLENDKCYQEFLIDNDKYRDGFIN